MKAQDARRTDLEIRVGEGSVLRSLLLVISLMAVDAVAAGAAALELTAARDNSVFAEAANSNGAGPALYSGNTGAGAARRTLIYFEVAQGLPPGAHIDSIAVTLEVTNAPNETPRLFTLHRVLRDWGEGASIASGGAGAAAEVGDATWQDAFFPGQRWSMPGGDYDPFPSSSQWVAGLGSYVWRGAGLTADVQAWLSGSQSNDGWLLKGEEIGLNTARRFSSREAGETPARPTLTIFFTPAAVATSPSWGSVKARYR